MSYFTKTWILDSPTFSKSMFAMIHSTDYVPICRTIVSQPQE